MIDEMAGEPVLLLCDMHIAPAAARKGLGKHCVSLLELISRKQARRVSSGASLPGRDLL